MGDTIEAEIQSGPAAEKDIELAFSGPAVLANRFFVSLGPHGVRIAFVEQGPNTASNFRTAVALSMQDAMGLYRVLRDMLKEPEAALEAMMAERLPKQNG